MDLNKVVLSLFLVALFSGTVSAVECWEKHVYTGGGGTQGFWLCVNGEQHGWIYAESPEGYPLGEGRMFKVELESYQHSSPYPAKLKCYEQFTGPVSRGGPGGFDGGDQAGQALDGGGGLGLYSKPQGPLPTWHFKQEVTLNDGDYTSSNSDWVKAGCPYIMNSAHRSGSPPQVRIAINWIGFGSMSVSRGVAVVHAVPAKGVPVSASKAFEEADAVLPRPSSDSFDESKPLVVKKAFKQSAAKRFKKVVKAYKTPLKVRRYLIVRR